MLLNYECDIFVYYDEVILALDWVRTCSYSKTPKKLDLDLKNRETPLVKPSIEETPMLELKELPSHLKYVFIGSGGHCRLFLQLLCWTTKWWHW